MPNPLLGRQRKLSTDPPDRPQPLEPIPESYEGDNNPYRGIETHGVTPTERFRDAPLDDQIDVIEYEKDKPEPPPVPVRIVHEGGKELKGFGVRREYAPSSTLGGAARILPRSEHRTGAKIRNLGTATVWIGPNESVTSWNGYPIPTGVEFAYDQESEVWAITDDPAQQPLAIYIAGALKE